ncbi:MAG TPA: M1 family aminopeptidase [Candidatus Acidoferrum sp.]|nr:M1 family aminopeptidase [Candidatus Acidoferrum sp.]
MRNSTQIYRRSAWRPKHVAASFVIAALALVVWQSSVTQALAQAGNQAPAPQASAIPPARYIPSHDFHTQNITLNLHFDFDHAQAIGTATLTLAPLMNDLKHVELDAGNLTVNSVKFASGTPLKFESDAKKEKLDITLDRAYQPSDSLTVVIDYHTNPDSPGSSFGGTRGLTFIKPTLDDPSAPKQIWSQGESEDNHFWFPCYDHPNDFTTTEIIATVEKPLSVVSNGKLLSVKENAGNTRTYDWKMDAPHATYLTSIVVGEYTPIEQTYNGIPVTTNVYPNQVTEGKVTAARMADMVRFFSEKTGVPYPYAKYAQTMAHNFGGGMENISATTMVDSMIHDERSELDGTADSLESHELAHQWFGDFVTCRSWADVWLNESFATYFQAMWDEKSLGRDDFLYIDVKSNQDQYFQAWRRGSRRPIVTENYADPDAVFDTYAYPRGGAVLHMLRTTLGEENWWRAIHHYLTKYAHQPVETEQFRIAIEEATGQSMDWFFDEWLYKMGHPIFRVTQAYDAGTKTLTLTVHQEQKVDPNSAYPQVAFFRMPVQIEIGSAAGTHIEKAMIEAKEEQTLSFNVDSEPLLVDFDYGGTLIKELHFEKTTAQLIYQLSHDTDVLGRIFALNELAAHMKNPATSAEENSAITKAIASAATSDAFWGVRVDSIGALRGVSSPDARTALLAALKDKAPRVRARALSVLSATKDASLAGVYLGYLNDPSYNVIRGAAAALGTTKDPGAYTALNKLLDQPSWRETIRISGLTGLGALGDPRAIDVALRFSARGNLLGVRGAALAVLGSAGKNDPRVYPVLAEAFTSAVDSGNFQLYGASSGALIALGDPRTLDLVKTALARTTNSQMQQFLTQMQKNLEDQAKKAATPQNP